MTTSEKILLELLDNDSHHAFLIVGERQNRFETFRHSFHEKISAKKMESADLWSREYETISIDDARAIREVQNTMPIGERRVMLFSFKGMQSEAQNSLLKLFEDPSSHTTFFVCVDDTSSFLPTLLSRFYIVQMTSVADASEPAGVAISKFLKSSYAGRLELLEPIIKEKDKTEAEKFLNALETALHEKMTVKTEGIEQRAHVFEDIFSARHFLRGRSPSVKMILEHICGIVPAIQ